MEIVGYVAGVKPDLAVLRAERKSAARIHPVCREKSPAGIDRAGIKNETVISSAYACARSDKYSSGSGRSARTKNGTVLNQVAPGITYKPDGIRAKGCTGIINGQCITSRVQSIDHNAVSAVEIDKA